MSMTAALDAYLAGHAPLPGAPAHPTTMRHNSPVRAAHSPASRSPVRRTERLRSSERAPVAESPPPAPRAALPRRAAQSGPPAIALRIRQMMKRRAMLVPQMWTSIDTHRNNTATRVQMARGIHSALGFALSTSEAKELFAYLDRDGDNRIIRADLKRLQQRGKSGRSRSPPWKRTENAAAQRNAAAATPMSPPPQPQPRSLPQPHPILRRPIAMPSSDAWVSPIALRGTSPPQRRSPQRHTAMGEGLDSDVPSVDEVAAMEERLGYLFAEDATEEAYPTDGGAARPMGAIEAFDLSLSLSSDTELTPPKARAFALPGPAAAAAAAPAAPTLAVRRPASIAARAPATRGTAAAAAAAAAAAPLRRTTAQWRKTPTSPSGLSMRAQAEANAKARLLAAEEAEEAELAATADEDDAEEEEAAAPATTPPGSPKVT